MLRCDRMVQPSADSIADSTGEPFDAIRALRAPCAGKFRFSEVRFTVKRLIFVPIRCPFEERV